MRDFFGLKLETVPANFIEKWKAYIAASPTVDPMTLGVALFTLGTIIVLKRFCPRIPWGIAAIALATLLCWALQIPTETVTSRFGDLPRTLPAPSLPSFDLSWAQYRSLIPMP